MISVYRVYIHSINNLNIIIFIYMFILRTYNPKKCSIKIVYLTAFIDYVKT